MIGKFKRWLGIEGVKVELELPEEVSPEEGLIEGRVHLFSQHAQTVEYIRIVLIERYSRGRGQEKLIDEYELGELTLDRRVEVPAEGMVSLDFRLPFTAVKSDVEEWGDQNLFFKGLSRVAARLRNAKSEYRVEAQAKVSGTALDPFDKKLIRIK